jgi:hypothetical protein
MTRKPSSLRVIYGALFVSVAAVVLPLTFYASGFPTAGGALLLSSVLVFAVTVVKSGALSAAWLAGETRGTIENATWRELAKALICAALTIDVLSDGAHLLDRHRLWNHPISWMVILTAAGLLAIAAGLFLTRWLAGYLGIRQ